MEDQVALTPENAHEAAAEAVQSSRDKLGIELDYSIESLETLDRLLNDLHASGRKSRDLGGAVILFGCYLGEVLIRKLGGKWVRAEDAGYTAATGFPIVLWLSEDLSCNPLGKVAKRIDNGSEDNLPFFFKALSGDTLVRRSNERFEASADEPSPPDINWPTRPDESGKVASVVGLMASSSGPEVSQVAYLMSSTGELTSRGWSPAEFQVVARGPGGLFTIPCVVKRGDEFAMIFSHAGPWAKADYARFKRWYEQVRGCENTKRTPIIIAHDNDPVVLREEGMTGDRYGISLERIEWPPENVPSREGGEGKPTTSPTPISGHAGGGRILPSSPAKPPTAMNQPRSPETETDLSRVNPYAAPRSLVDVNERPTATRATGYAGFWLRFVAVVLDTILLSVVNFAIFFALGLLTVYVAAEDSTARRVIGAAAYILPILVNLAYFVLMESSYMQATLGKAAMGIKVVDLHGRRISLSRSFGRWMGKWLSTIIFMVGYIMAAFTEKKQALHDMMAGTLVVKTR